MATALGIAPDSSGTGTDALQLRKIIQSRWASTGIVTGLGCSGRSDLRYQLAAGVAVTQRSTADGCTEAYWQGGTTAAVATGDASNPRIDVVYLKANDPTQGDADNQVVAGVAEGTPAASPVQPSIPAGSVAVAVKRMPAGATATSSATTLTTPDYAIPYGASTGILLKKIDTSNGLGSSSWMTSVTGSFFVPMSRYIRVDVTTSLQGVVPDVGTATDGSCYIRLLIDGAQKFLWERITNATAASQYYSEYMEIGEGTHTIALQLQDGTAGFRRYYDTNGWPGQAIVVSDEGVA